MMMVALAAAFMSIAPPAQQEPVDLTPTPRGCEFAARLIADFTQASAAAGHQFGVDARWLTLPDDRAELAEALRQDQRERGPNPPFGLGYDRDFAAAIETMSEADIDTAHAALSSPGDLDCDALDVTTSPFSADIAALERWAEAQMLAPDPGAPPAVETYGLSRPIFFDGERRVLVAQAYSFTPIPMSRPPSAMVGFAIYQWQDQRWVREAGLLIARGG